MTISLSTRFFSRNYLFTFSLGKRKTKIHAFVSRISYYFLFLVRLPPCFAPPSPLWTRDLPVRRCSIWVGSNSHGAPVIDFMVFWEIYVIDSFFFLLFRFASLSPPPSPPSLASLSVALSPIPLSLTPLILGRAFQGWYFKWLIIDGFIWFLWSILYWFTSIISGFSLPIFFFFCYVILSLISFSLLYFVFFFFSAAFALFSLQVFFTSLSHFFFF